MSLAIVRDLSKYTRANHQGEIQFSKLGLLPKKSEVIWTIDRDALLSNYSSPQFYQFQFLCDKFEYLLKATDINYTSEESQSKS